MNTKTALAKLSDATSILKRTYLCQIGHRWFLLFINQYSRSSISPLFPQPSLFMGQRIRLYLQKTLEAFIDSFNRAENLPPWKFALGWSIRLTISRTLNSNGLRCLMKLSPFSRINYIRAWISSLDDQVRLQLRSLSQSRFRSLAVNKV